MLSKHEISDKIKNSCLTNKNITSSSKPKICIPIFITVFVIGNLVILNLFLALLLNSFSGDVLQQTAASSNSFAVAGERIKRWTIILFKKIPGCFRRIQSFCVNNLWKKYFLFRKPKDPLTLFDADFPPIKAAVCGVDDAFSRSPSLRLRVLKMAYPEYGIGQKTFWVSKF